jgi:carbonic anhydrase/acetyltransferase-like protein (isoleucine patch superfamily)
VPRIGEGTYVSESAEIVGDVEIGEECYVGPGAKIKGDYGSVRIGSRTSVQENCVIHARPGEICTVGDLVNVGHGSILHTCTVKDHAVLGMGCIVSDYAIVGEWAAIGEGCVVKSRQLIADKEIAVGVPAKVIGKITEEYQQTWRGFKDEYVKLARRYQRDLERIA